MIAKHFPMREASKSSMGRLVRYITDTKDNEHRVGDITYINLAATSPEAAIFEMELLQSLNKRTKQDKTYHLLISFRSGEHPDSQTLRMIENRICTALGFAEHQRLSVVHHDTDNLHIHLAINKIHPHKLTALTPYNDYYILQQECLKLEQEFGLEIDNHQIKKTLAQNKADDMEHQSGIESLLGWIQRNNIAHQLNSANCWQQLHQILAANGLVISKRGNGLIIKSLTEDVQVKASSLGREFSKANLECRLGCFVSSELFEVDVNQHNHSSTSQASSKETTAQDRSSNNSNDANINKTNKTNKINNRANYYRKRPITYQLDSSKLWAQYMAEREQISKRRPQLIKHLKQRKQDEIALIWQEFKQQRQTLVKPMTYQIAQQLVQESNCRHRDELKQVFTKYRHQSWFEWLQRQAWHGDQQALDVLRERFDKQKLEQLRQQKNKYQNEQNKRNKRNQQSWHNKDNQQGYWFGKTNNAEPIIRFKLADIKQQQSRPVAVTKQGTQIYYHDKETLRVSSHQITLENRATKQIIAQQLLVLDADQQEDNANVTVKATPSNSANLDSNRIQAVTNQEQANSLFGNYRKLLEETVFAKLDQAAAEINELVKAQNQQAIQRIQKTEKIETVQSFSHQKEKKEKQVNHQLNQLLNNANTQIEKIVETAEIKQTKETNQRHQQQHLEDLHIKRQQLKQLLNQHMQETSNDPASEYNKHNKPTGRSR